MVVLRVVGPVRQDLVQRDLLQQDSAREEAAKSGVNGAPVATYRLTVKADECRELAAI